MSNLISKSARDLIGIDSPWRGIVWAALMLRAGNVHPSRIEADANYPHKNAVRIAGGRQVVLGGLQSFITIEATLPYSSPEALADAGDFLPFVGEYFAGNSPTYTGTACSMMSGLGYPYSGIGEGMPPDDVDVDSLEKYLVWCFLLGELELLNPTPNALLPISLDFLEEAPGGASLKLSAKLFIDYIGYRASDNLICSVIPPSVTPAVIPAPDPSLDVEWINILHKPDFAIVAISGDYDDLENTPTIPTKTSDLENDSNFLDEVDFPVTSVNGMTGAVQITAAIGQAEWVNVLNKPDFADVATSGNYADLLDPPTIPTKTSDLENDTNFLTEVTYPVTSVNGQTGDVVLALGGNGDGGGTSFTYFSISANTTAQVSGCYYCQPTYGLFLQFPATANNGDQVGIVLLSGAFVNINNFTILSRKNILCVFTYTGTTWVSSLDGHSSHLVLLNHFEGLNNQQSILSEIGPSFVSTSTNNSLKTSDKKFGNTSLLCNGSNLVASNSTPSLVLTGDFTIEFWFKCTAKTAYWTTFMGFNAEGGWVVRLQNTSNMTLNFAHQSNFNTDFGGSLNLNTWYHVAYSCKNYSLSCFVDGVLLATSTIAPLTNINPVLLFVIGSLTVNNSEAYTGYIDELRIFNGISLYDSAFSLPSMAYIP